jgi:hypothetical protein
VRKQFFQAHLRVRGGGGAGDDVVEGLTDRDDAVDGQPIGVVHQHLLHHLERSALALHQPGQAFQGVDQGRENG